MNQPQRILIVGGTSAIAEAMARRLAARGDRLCLAARNDAKLDTVAKDLRVRTPGCFVNCYPFDAAQENQTRAQQSLLTSAERSMGGLDVVIICHGTLPDAAACARSPEQTVEALQINAISTITLMSIAAHRFEQQGSGTIAVLSSVAGDRGRASNYVYGSAKAMVSAFASGLGQKLRSSGVKVVNIKPGFVDTPMTAGFKKGPLWAAPDTVARRAIRAIDAGTPVVYAPGFWFFIMAIIKSIPERMFVRIKL